MSEREWRFYLNDMIDFVEKVLSYAFPSLLYLRNSPYSVILMP